MRHERGQRRITPMLRLLNHTASGDNSRHKDRQLVDAPVNGNIR
jgi:hypothetical protein